MGRTGAFLACEGLGVSPDYVLLSKALGGGLAKISATLIKRDRHVDKFDVLHTSTYAEDDYSSGIALKALELLDDAALVECRRKGDRLMNRLLELMAVYPDVIVDVRGRGLMIAVEFRRMLDSPSFILRLLTNQDDLVYVLVGYLFNVHRIRVAPTLSDPQSIRLEPSLLVDDSEIDRFLAALDDVCAKLREHDVIGLTRYFIEGTERAAGATTRVSSDTKFVIYDEPPYWKRELDPPPLKVAWMFHLIDGDDFITLEPGAARPHLRAARAVPASFRSACEPDRHELVRCPVGHGRDGSVLRDSPAAHVAADEAGARRPGFLSRAPLDR